MNTMKKPSEKADDWKERLVENLKNFGKGMEMAHKFGDKK